MDEDTALEACFDHFRRDPTVGIQWVKEQVYRTSCVPEQCPDTRSLEDILRPEKTNDFE
ncbi:unnamed protein product [Pylaiella littoralis]